MRLTIICCGSGALAFAFSLALLTSNVTGVSIGHGKGLVGGPPIFSGGWHSPSGNLSLPQAGTTISLLDQSATTGEGVANNWHLANVTVLGDEVNPAEIDVFNQGQSQVLQSQHTVQETVLEATEPVVFSSTGNSEENTETPDASPPAAVPQFPPEEPELNAPSPQQAGWTPTGPTAGGEMGWNQSVHGGQNTGGNQIMSMNLNANHIDFTSSSSVDMQVNSFGSGGTQNVYYFGWKEDENKPKVPITTVQMQL